MEEKFKLIQFGAEWCAPCRKQLQEFETHPLNGAEFEFKDCDNSDNDILVEKYGIMSVPTLVLLEKTDEGYEMINKWVGTQNPKSIQEYIDNLK